MPARPDRSAQRTTNTTADLRHGERAVEIAVVLWRGAGEVDLELVAAHRHGARGSRARPRAASSTSAASYRPSGSRRSPLARAAPSRRRARPSPRAVSSRPRRAHSSATRRSPRRCAASCARRSPRRSSGLRIRATSSAISAVGEPRRRDHDALVGERPRVRGHAPRLAPADVGVVRAADREAERGARHERDVRQVRAAGERVVEHEDLARPRRSCAITAATASGIAPRWTGMCSACAIIRPSLVEERARAVAALLDVRRERGADEHRVHLVRDRPERAPEHLEPDRRRHALSRIRHARVSRSVGPSLTPTHPWGSQQVEPSSSTTAGPFVADSTPAAAGSSSSGAGTDIGRPHRHELELTLRIRVAVPLLVRAVEPRREVGAERDGQLERLPAVAEVGLALVGQLAGLARAGTRTTARGRAARRSRPARAPRARRPRPARAPSRSRAPRRARTRAAARRRRTRRARSHAGRARARPRRAAPRAASPRSRPGRRRPDRCPRARAPRARRRARTRPRAAAVAARAARSASVTVGRVTAPAVAGGPGIRACALRTGPQRPAGVAPQDRSPPAPTVCRSTVGSRTGRPPTARSLARPAAPPSIRHTSVDVPPMSNEIAVSKPARRATSAAPTTPAAGPETSTPRRVRGRLRQRRHAAGRAHHERLGQGRPPRTRSRAAAGSPTPPARGTRPSPSSTRARTRGTRARPRATRPRARRGSRRRSSSATARSCARVAEREQQADGDRVRVDLRQRAELERRDHPVRPDPLADAEAALERHERLGMLPRTAGRATRGSAGAGAADARTPRSRRTRSARPCARAARSSPPSSRA